jgi:hypothetical protein
MKLLICAIAAAEIAVTPSVLRYDPCPPKFEIGQSYHEIQQGPCPDIDSVASFKPDSTHTVYLCKSQHIAVVGSMVTGKMEGFFLYRP